MLVNPKRTVHIRKTSVRATWSGHSFLRGIVIANECVLKTHIHVYNMYSDNTPQAYHTYFISLRNQSILLSKLNYW